MPIDPAKPFDLTFRVDPTWADLRLDSFVKAMVPSMSRTKIQKYIKADRIEVNGEARPANWKVRLDDTVLLRCNEPEGGSDAARDIPLDILYEDEDILLVNKQAGLVVHPVGKNRHNTLLNALYWRYKDILPPEQEISLANRLDRDTSGVILVLKHKEAKRIVQEDFEARAPKKSYLALTEGRFAEHSGEIDAPIGPAVDRNDHCLMGVRHDDMGKPSRTSFTVLEKFESHTLVRLELHTGRQHQIRVHMKHIGHPLICDARYGNPNPLVLTAPTGEHVSISRFALHAADLTFTHPMTQQEMSVSAPLATDISAVLDALREGWSVEEKPG